MKVRGLLVAVIPLAVLAGAVYWSNKSEAARAAKPAVAADASPKLITINEDQLTSVSLAHKDAPPTVLEKNESGKWKMVAPKTYAVDQDVANTTLSAATGLVWDRLVEDKVTDFKPY